MSDKGDGTIHYSSEHGVVATHPARETQPLLVAPTTVNELNTLGLDIVAVGCLSLHDVLFEFDSSFVTPDVTILLKQLPPLREGKKSSRGELPPLSLFGHADPVGDDNYNKQLSGRRAKAIFGLLTRKVEVWQQLLNSTISGGDNWRSKNVVKKMRDFVGGSPKTEKELIEAYMAAICPFVLGDDDFLARGTDPKKLGKGDFQGCSEFNPLVLLGKSEKLTEKQRNEENLPNRRVLIYLFAGGTKIKPALWPCPRTSEGIAECRLRFFSDGDKRRAQGPDRREFAKTKDTFACRFYSRIAHLSPCEQPAPSGDMLQILDELDDPVANRRVLCRLSNGKQVDMVTDKNGCVRVSGSLILEIEIDDLHKLS